MSIGYQPNGSNYHDHLCNCPGCNSDGPEPIVIECDVIIHTEGRPFCNQADCPCREDFENIKLLVDLQKAGLLTTDEANMVMRGVTI